MILSDIRTQVRRRANMENSQFVTDPELLLYINGSFGELYDILVGRFEDYFIKLDPVTNKPPEFTLSGTTSSYAVPTDMYKLRGLDIQNNGVSYWSEVTRYNLKERNTRSRSIGRSQYGERSLSYRTLGNRIQILPEDQAAGTYRLIYVPRFTPLVLDSDDTAGSTLDFEEYIIVDAAIKCLVKEESDVSALMSMKEQLRQRIMSMSSERDAGSKERVANVRRRMSSRFGRNGLGW